MAKILYSPGYGAGWSTWMGGSREFQRWVLTYQPVIDAVERGDNLAVSPNYFITDHTEHPERLLPLHPALQRLLAEAKEKFGENSVCILGAGQLCVAEVSGPFRIDEYDGSESIVTAGDEEWISLCD